MKMEKSLSWIRLYRQYFLELRKNLSDQEIVLFLYYAVVADWDRRHESFEVAKRTNKEVSLEMNFSAGKVSKVTNSLIKKGYITRTARSSLQINNYANLFRSEKRLPKQIVQKPKQTVHSIEQTVQDHEPSQTEVARRKLKDELIKLGIYRKRD